MNLAALGRPPADFVLSRFREWGIEPDDLDAADVKRRLERLWTRWSFKDKLGLLSTAEALARAEKAKRASTRTSKKTDYLAMSLAGVAAFKLAEQVSRLLPPPLDAEHAVIGKFCRQLTGFGGAALYATGVSDRELAVGFAERLIRDLRRTSRSHTR